MHLIFGICWLLIIYSHMKYLSSIDVAKIMGCNDSTIRRWADKGIINCKKTPGGNRFFTIEDIRECIKKNHSNTKTSSLGIKGNSLKRIYKLTNDLNYKELSKIILDKSIQSDDLIVSEIINSLYIKGINVEDIFDKLILKSIYLIEELLISKKITHVQEYIARQMLTKCIQTLNINKPNGSYNGKSILCINFEDNVPDIGVVMSEVVLRHYGYNVYNAGSHAELGNIEKTLDLYKIDSILFYLCDLQCCNSIIKDNIIKTENQIKQICSLAAKNELNIYLGGEGLEFIKFKENNFINSFKSFTDLSHLLK